MNYEDVKNLKAGDFKRLCGVTKETFAAMCEIKEGRFPSAYQLPIKTGNGQIWLVPEKDLNGFEPPSKGRKQSDNPSKATLAKRAQREREKVDK